MTFTTTRRDFNRELAAAQGIVDQAFADLDQQFNALDAQVKALMDQKDARIADVLVTCISNLPAP